MTTKTVEAAANNPVTTVAAFGAVIAAIGHFAGWDRATQLVVVQGALGAALLMRTAIAGWHAYRSR